jgi:hypothetical protein
MTRRPLRLQLELQDDSDPISGRLLLANNDGVVFNGWLELIAAIEAARTHSESGFADPMEESSPAAVPWPTDTDGEDAAKGGAQAEQGPEVP